MISFSCACSLCGREYEFTPERMLCDECSSRQTPDQPLMGVLEFRPSGELPREWDSLYLLPVERAYFPAVPVGNTPLWEPELLRRDTGFPQLYLKDDSRNPTGSLKDRASYLVAAYAKREGIDRIVVASTGNAGSSMAGIGAAAGIKIKLFLPAAAPAAKLVQSLQYGADLERVDGTYDAAYDRSMAFISTEGGLSRNTAHNPLTIEGKKTVSLEIYRQLGGRVPDYVFVPTGDGVILSGVYRGFEDLVSLGLADRVPHCIAVQAEGSAAIYRALNAGIFGDPVGSATFADSISVDVPRGGLFALKRLQRHNGSAVTVTDEQILTAQRRLSSRSGLFAEPAAAAAWAGFEKMKDRIDPEATVVVLITGNGLKDIDAAKKGVDSL
ncbi:pyridoxal-phosphate dependent enzyme [Marispirochaeta sp.]|jgi:threonine synthase|uniref:threonine synthase n=1 Tax=Marispirochaeta sp. TaxID=2038653 RepID=UPI0029C8B5EA|nr:pyridoxal-phosphate dependent enzyme [Marispirochaeta sp.]